jgi:flagellin
MRIGSNLHVTDLSALSNLNKVYQQLNRIALQLSTGLRINRGADDPAGLAAAESLQSELVSTEQASRNTSFARYSLEIADAGMGQSLELLQEIRANVVAAADGTLSDAGRAALQQEVDAALQQIDNIGSNTNFAGRKLLDGSTLTFQLLPDAAENVSLQMPDVSAAALGGLAGTLMDLASGGSANLQNGDLDKAQAILDQAEQQILAARTKNGAFEKYTIESSSTNRDVMQVNLTSALSDIRDTDVAQAMSGLIRTEIFARSLIEVVKTTLQSRTMAIDLLKD